MKETANAIKLARVASGMSQNEAASVLGVSVPTYAAREKAPASFTVDEIKDLNDSFNEQGKQLVKEFVAGFLRIDM